MENVENVLNWPFHRFIFVGHVLKMALNYRRRRKMKLEKHKFYKRRDGAITGPAEERGYDVIYPFKVGDIYYLTTGRVSESNESMYDLIEEITAHVLPEQVLELSKDSQNSVDAIHQRVLAYSFNKGDNMSKSNESEEKKSRPKYPAEQLKDVENTLISLITTTVHYTALKYLTQALADVRCANTCLDENKRFFYGSE